MPAFESGIIIDGYRLIRKIGSGGFGTVWLCQLQATGEYLALKFIPASTPGILQKEKNALIQYRKKVNPLHSPHLLPIEHVNETADGLYYIMPLADGHGADSPTDIKWQPWTFRALLNAQKEKPSWFTSQEIIRYISPILDALQTLADANLVHRDVKPDNILIRNGNICLADISLLKEYTESSSLLTTPGYGAPSWYVETGGHIDMYSAATTLYTLLTGNHPDKLGRSRFLWPPQGKESLSPAEKSEWQRIHHIILKATDESPEDRFPDYTAFKNELNATSSLNTFQTFVQKIKHLNTDNSSQPSKASNELNRWKKILEEYEDQYKNLMGLHAHFITHTRFLLNNLRYTEVTPETLIKTTLDLKLLIQDANEITKLNERFYTEFNRATHLVQQKCEPLFAFANGWLPLNKLSSIYNSLKDKISWNADLSHNWGNEIQSLIINFIDNHLSKQNKQISKLKGIDDLKSDSSSNTQKEKLYRAVTEKEKFEKIKDYLLKQ